MSLDPQDLDLIALETNSQTLRDALHAIIQRVNAIDDRVTPLTEGYGAMVDQPTLSPGDAGFIFSVSDYNHRVRWSGSIWEWAPGDPGNDRIELLRAAPVGNGWQLCDGTATDFLTVGGAALTTTNFTTPNISGNPGYLKAGAAYAGVAAAVAPGISGTTANEGAHTHPVNPPDTTTSGATAIAGAGGQVGVGADHTHTVDIAEFSSGVGSNHAHGVGTLAVDATAEPRRTTWLPYYRR